MVFPAPVISIAVAPKDKGGSETGLHWANDPGRPSFQVETDQDSGETILKGMERTAPGYQSGHPQAYLRRRADCW